MDLLVAYLPRLTNSGAKVELVSSNPVERNYVYTLSFALEEECPTSNGISSFNLGGTGNLVIGGLRLTRDKCYWLFAHQSYALPSHTDTEILALHGSEHVLIALPLTTDDYMATLRGPIHEYEKGSIFIRFDRNHPSSAVGQVAITIAGDLSVALESAVGHARALLGKHSDLALRAPALFKDKLTYCTWNSLQPPTRTIAKSALVALEHFRSIGVRPSTFLIDDAWQDTNSKRLQSFGSTPQFLAEYQSLAEVVKVAKEKYGVRNVGVWHTIQGYWQGVEVEKFANRYRLVKVTKDGYPGPAEPEGFQYYILHPDSVQSFFKDYYETLRASGITFTKCDNMASIDHIASAVTVSFTASGEEVLGEPVDLPKLRKAYVRAVKSAARETFGAENVIWCMGMTPRVLLGQIGLGGDHGVRRVVRNSDDYYPNEPDSHRYHVFTNVLNALFLNNLDVQPDLDMFQTHAYISPEGTVNDIPMGLAQASFHASFRIFGTGPVTITDTPLKSNPQILHKLVGNLAPASTSPSVVVQASKPFTVLNDIFDQTILGHGTGKGLKVYVNNTIGVWNVRAGNGKVVEFITPSDISQALSLPTKTPLPLVILYIQSSNPSTLGNPRTLLHDTTNPLHPAPPVRIDLDPLGWATVGVAVVEKEIKVACLGLVDKYLAGSGVERTEVKGGGLYVVDVRCSGTLGIWVGTSVKVRSARASLVGEDGMKGSEKDVEFEIEELTRGKKITVEVKGRSEVTFQLLKNL